MREYSLSINQEELNRSVQFDFDTDGGCHFLTIKAFKANKAGELESTSVIIDPDDVEALMEFLQAFQLEHAHSQQKEKGA